MATSRVFGSLLTTLAMLLAGAHPVRSQTESKTFYVDAVNGLADLKASVETVGEGKHFVRFQHFKNVGELALAGSSADTLVFMPDAPQTVPLEVTGKLLSLERTSTTIILKGLTLSLSSGAQLVNGFSANPNGSLTIDSCLVYSQNLNNAFLGWTGGAGSVIRISTSSFVSAAGGSSLAMRLEADEIHVTGSYFNLPRGVLYAEVRTGLWFQRNSIDRMQMDLDGNLLAGATFSQNVWLQPPDSSMIDGSAQTVAMKLLNFGAGVANQNALNPAWSGGFELVPKHFKSENDTVALDTTRTGIFDVRLTNASNAYGHHVRSNGVGGLAFNLLPNTETWRQDLPQLGTSATLTFNPSVLPRWVSLTEEALPSAALPPDCRLLGPAGLRFRGFGAGTSVAFGTDPLPAGDRQWARWEGGAWVLEESHGTSANFAWPENPASLSVPVLGGQSIVRGNSISLSLSDGYAVAFDSVSVPGMPTLNLSAVPSGTPALPDRRRTLATAANQAWMSFTTNAETGGGVTLSLDSPKMKAAFDPDSVFFVQPDGEIQAILSQGRWQVTLPDGLPDEGLSGQWVERLRQGKGQDTLRFAGGLLTSSSGEGMQVRISESPSREDCGTPAIPGNMEPLLGPYYFDWTSAADTDELEWSLDDKDALQIVFRGSCGSDELQNITDTEKHTGLKVRLMGTDVEAGNAVFYLAKLYAIAKNDSDAATGASGLRAENILTSTPGNLIVEPTDTYQDSVPFFIPRAQITLREENLTLEKAFDLVVPAPDFRVEERILILTRAEENGEWDTLSLNEVKRDAERNEFILSVNPGTKVVLLGEYYRETDTEPAVPEQEPEVKLEDNVLTITPTLTPDEAERLAEWKVRIIKISPSGEVEIKTTSVPPKSTYTEKKADDGSLLGYEIIYTNFADQDATTMDAPVFPGDQAIAHWAKFSDKAPELNFFRWELIGFPVAQSKEQLGPDFEESGRWLECCGSDTANPWVEHQLPNLERGKGYLWGGAADDRKLIFDVPQQTPLPLKATVELQKGWQFISSPLPFDIDEDRIDFPRDQVSRFHALTYDGPGKDAKGFWDPVATLTAYKGYAVYAKQAVVLEFDLLRPVAEDPGKVGAGTDGRLTFIGEASGESVAKLEIGPSRTRPSPVPPALQRQFRAGWLRGKAWVTETSNPEWPRVRESVAVDNPQSLGLRWRWESQAPENGFIQRIWDPLTGKAYAPDERLPEPGPAGRHAWEFLSLPADEMEAALKQRLIAVQPPRLIHGLSRRGNAWEVRLTLPQDGQTRKVRLRVAGLDGSQTADIRRSHAGGELRLPLPVPPRGGALLMQVVVEGPEGKTLSESRILAPGVGLGGEVGP